MLTQNLITPNHHASKVASEHNISGTSLNPQAGSENRSIITGRFGGIVLSVLCAGLLSNLHGCSRYYIENAQSNWLSRFERFAPNTTGVSSKAGNPYEGTVKTLLAGRLQDPHISELSGLAASNTRQQVFWAINDSGNASQLFAMNSAGRSLATVEVPVPNRDWEDLASFTVNNTPWLMVADTGDNLKRRKSNVLYFFPEPVLTAESVGDVRAVEFRYEDGPQNIESVAVSVPDGSIYFVAKKARSANIYQLPLSVMNSTTDTNSDVPIPVARVIGELPALSFTKDDPLIEQMFGARFLLGPTAMDISADNNLAVIANYRHVYLYRKQEQQSWLQAFQGKPQVLTSHRLAQSESIAFSADAGTVLVGSEGIQAPLLLIADQRAVTSDTADVDSHR